MTRHDVRPDLRQDAAPAGATVAEAAARLRVTPDAVRRRLHRGTLAGAKTAAGEWRVWFPEAEAGDPPGPRQDVARTRQDAPPAETEALRSHVADLRAEVAYLRDQLDQRSGELAAERERADVLHREALARFPVLPAGDHAPPAPLDAPGGAGPTQPAQEPAVARWRRWLRRWAGTAAVVVVALAGCSSGPEADLRAEEERRTKVACGSTPTGDYFGGVFVWDEDNQHCEILEEPEHAGDATSRALEPTREAAWDKAMETKEAEWGATQDAEFEA